MAAIHIQDLLKDPSALVRLIEQREEITILQEDIAIAEVKPVLRSAKKPYVFGTYEGEVWIADDFDTPMEIVDARNVRR